MNYAARAAALAEALAADGYQLAIAEAGPTLSVVITAGPDACADCLVPKNLMRSMLGSELGVDPALIELTYPADA